MAAGVTQRGRLVVRRTVSPIVRWKAVFLHGGEPGTWGLIAAGPLIPLGVDLGFGLTNPLEVDLGFGLMNLLGAT